MFPYEFPAAEIARRLNDNGLTLELFNAPAGDWAAGDRGCAAIPGCRQEFRDGVRRALDYAAALACPRLHLMAGVTPDGAARDALLATYASNLDWAADECAKGAVKPVIEPINHRDIPGYILHTTSEAAAIIGALGPERIRLQFDLYHCQVTEGDIVRRMRELLPIIEHMQIADNPGRHEPGTGEINWPFLFQAIDETGFEGWVGCEYRPAGDTVAGLSWFAHQQKAGAKA
jgi:hydroxypyruvate isomerase